MPKPVLISLGNINMDVQARAERWPTREKARMS